MGDNGSTRRNIVSFLTHEANKEDASVVLEGPPNLETARNVGHSKVGYTEPCPNVPFGMVSRLPKSMVRHLVLSDEDEFSHSPYISSYIQPSSSAVLSELFVNLIGMVSISYHGTLLPTIFANIVNVKNLTFLSLRMSLEQIELPESRRLTATWRSVVLDLGALETLPHL